MWIWNDNIQKRFHSQFYGLHYIFNILLLKDGNKFRLNSIFHDKIVEFSAPMNTNQSHVNKWLPIVMMEMNEQSVALQRG